MNEGLNAAIFYLSATALVAGTIRTLRASVERNARDRTGVALTIVGGLGFAVAIIAFLTGPKRVLPF